MKFYGKAEESAKVILEAFRNPNTLLREREEAVA
jgi:hypothetical protein